MVPDPFPTVPNTARSTGPERPQHAPSTPPARRRHVEIFEKYAALVIAAPLIVFCYFLLVIIRIKEFLR